LPALLSDSGVANAGEDEATDDNDEVAAWLDGTMDGGDDEDGMEEGGIGARLYSVRTLHSKLCALDPEPRIAAGPGHDDADEALLRFCRKLETKDYMFISVLTRSKVGLKMLNVSPYSQQYFHPEDIDDILFVHMSKDPIRVKGVLA
ncbi:hypothetical protein EJB05_08812, partial [Eragrostis curvula]